MRWITTKRGNRVLIDDYSYYKTKEKKLTKEEYARVSSEINTNLKKWKPGINKFVLYNYKKKKYYKYGIYYEGFDRYVIYYRKEDREYE